MCITIKIKFQIQNLKISTNEKPHLNKEYQIKMVVYTLGFIPILKIKLNSKKIINNQKLQEKIKQQKTKIIENKANVDKELIKSLKNIKTEIPVISTFIAIFLSKQIKKYNDKQVFLVEPVYLDKNLLNIEISSIFQIKMIHIINTICIVNKKRKGDKNERTSNRRPDDYGYEQY